MVLADRDREKPESVEFPFRLRGNLIMTQRVEEVSPDGVARIELTYRDFDFEVVNKVREREVKVVINSEGSQTWEGDRLLNEISADQDDFPLREMVEDKFSARIDQRGRIQEMKLPSGLSDTIPYLSLNEVLDQAQPAFPEESIPEGESWIREVDISLPGRTQRWGGDRKWSSKIEYTFQSRDKKEDKEEYLFEVKGTIAQPEAPAVVQEEPESGVNTFIQNLSGEILFDPSAGEVISSRIQLEQKVKVAIEVGRIMRDTGFDIDVDFKLRFNINRRPSR